MSERKQRPGMVGIWVNTFATILIIGAIGATAILNIAVSYGWIN